ncbi:NAD(P)H-dependent oxidoreductase [Flavicella sp.]|uniref:NAD(P)H-dependent oxidoreductase n=1 Tax=Flavicella sp. TaxID=2957742 RepID=UPI0026298915|nr:NAD(P)H-dependent oxidoreductase [Flavicella sp.]MDG1803721.1 NAD(P)H-dependent oxidoreductase [Flavicella sp.]
MDILESLQWRYATKKFDSEFELNSEQLDILKESFNLTATSFGLQPIKLIVIKNKELRESLVSHAYGQRQVADASHLFVICIQKEASVEDVENYFKLVKEIRNTPDDILAPFKDYLTGTFEKTEQEELLRAAKSQAYIALGNLLTVCATQKIDSCPMEGFNPDKFDKVLNLDQHNLKSVLLLPVGKRAEDDYMAELKKVRKPLDSIILEM